VGGRGRDRMIVLPMKSMHIITDVES
jgi:hypothetical protein